MRQAGRFLEAAGPGSRVETLFMGGGTPSCLPRRELRALLAAFSVLGCEEWTVEANPETLDDSFLSACEEAGVTRLSVGIQSLRPRHLLALRRRATREDAVRAVSLLSRRWHGELNLDFITGIPGQSEAELREDIHILDDVQCGHVSLYQLTVEQGTPLERMVQSGEMLMNAQEQDEELWLAGREELLERGYGQYEVSNFCLPGRQCRHNLRYWRIDPYAGAGPGAVSTLPAAWAARAAGRPDLAAEPNAVVRFTNPKDLDSFLGGQERFWGIETEIVSARDFLLETLMMGLRLTRGIPQAILASRFGGTFDRFFPGLWNAWVEQGWAVPEKGVLRLSDRGILLLDYLLGQVVERLGESGVEGLSVSWP